MKKFIDFRPDPARPINYKNTDKWEKVGKCYRLKSPDAEEDRQFLYMPFAHVGADGKSAGKKEYRDDKRLYIAGMANANIIDRMDEVLDPRGLDTTDYIKNSQLLAHHSYYAPIGQVETLDIEEDGVHFVAWVGDPGKAPLTNMQKEIRSLIAQGILKTVSVGFIPKKIRPGAYDDRGCIVDPWVIEEWELLELSVVAVPANQDSVFEMKDFSSSKNNGTLKSRGTHMKTLNEIIEAISKRIKLGKCKGVVEILEELAKDGAGVQRLTFSKESFEKDEAISWAKEYGLKSDEVFEDDSVIVLTQKDEKDFQDDSLVELELDKGVVGMVGKSVMDNEPTKDGTESDGDDQSEDDGQKEALMLIKNVDATLKRAMEALENILKKLDEKASSCEDDDNEEDDSEKVLDNPSETSNASDESIKAIDDRITGLEKTIDKLADAMKLLAEKP